MQSNRNTILYRNENSLCKILEPNKMQNITGICKMYLIIARGEISFADKKALNIMEMHFNISKSILVFRWINIKQHHNNQAAELITLRNHFPPNSSAIHNNVFIQYLKCNKKIGENLKFYINVKRFYQNHSVEIETVRQQFHSKASPSMLCYVCHY